MAWGKKNKKTKKNKQTNKKNTTDAAHKLTTSNNTNIKCIKKLWSQLLEGSGHTVYKRRAHTERWKRL